MASASLTDFSNWFILEPTCSLRTLSSSERREQPAPDTSVFGGIPWEYNKILLYYPQYGINTYQRMDGLEVVLYTCTCIHNKDTSLGWDIAASGSWLEVVESRAYLWHGSYVTGFELNIISHLQDPGSVSASRDEHRSSGNGSLGDDGEWGDGGGWYKVDDVGGTEVAGRFCDRKSDRTIPLMTYTARGKHTLCKTIANGIDSRSHLCKFWKFQEDEYSTGVQNRGFDIEVDSLQILYR